MSKIKFGALVVDARGKSGGTIFSRNAYGSYWKNRVIPINGQTEKQQEVRAQLAARSNGWRSLNDTARRAWTDMAASYPRQNSLGDTIILTGLALLNSLNGNLQKIGAALLSVPVAPVTLQIVTASIGTLTDTAFTIVQSATLDANTRAVIRCTPPISAGINNWANRLRDMAVLDTGTGATYNAFSTYDTQFGPLTTGSRVGVSYQLVDERTGQASTPLFFSAIVA